MYGRQLLEVGLRWQIGNGRTASLIHSQWIPRFQLDSPSYNPQILPGEGDPKVADVICQGEGRWCDTKLSQWFDPSTCRTIKAIPLPRQNMEDKMIWHDTKDGVFTVKSAYHLAVSLDRRKGGWKSLASWMDKASWVRLWNANIPPKLKVFVWQILNRALPTTEALIERKVPIHPRYPVCWASSETMEHLFLDCPVAGALWDYSGLDYLGEGLPRHTFPYFLKKLLALIHQPTLFMAVVAVLWRIWRSRNWVVFEGKQFGFPALMRQFHQQYEEWMALPLAGPMHVSCPTGSHQLAPVAADSIVCMWDGATKSGCHSAGGIVLFTP
ncbi:unnamed protein product [Linum trigynum]|uniref:Reverse transcriptase zinc-binding domain-containing protein n=1 Tax=Linum trigynum TaxID=586398 RepID=A0AAV2ENY0_9ROSI